jgi:pimeloyl-ACP methyl ester carboxylesterase
MKKKKAIFFMTGAFAVAVLIFRSAPIFLSVAAENISQPDFSSVQSEGWGSYSAAIGIASGTVSEIGTTTAALGTLSRAYLGWECDMRLEYYAAPIWCQHYIQLTVATTTIVGTSTPAYVFQNPHQAIDGDAQLFYAAYYPGNPDYMGFGTATNTVPGLSWAWTCGPYCRSGGMMGGTSPYFVPYIQMGPQADPPSVTGLVQSEPEGSAVPAEGVIAGSSATLGAIAASPSGDGLVFEVEVLPSTTPLRGVATASSSVAAGNIVMTVKDLTDGDYHWAARVVDAVTHESSPWTAFSSDGKAVDFTIRHPKEPVVFVPGILGTRLARAADGHEVWPDLSTLLFSPDDRSLDDLMLAADGTQIPGKEMTAGPVIDQVSALGVNVPLYRHFFDALAADGYRFGTTLFPVAYDWRLGINDAAAAVAKVVAAARAASPDGKVMIVGYSMGGLAVKEYLADQQDTSWVSKLILVGAPQLGAPEAFQALHYGDNLGFQVPVLGLDILNRGEVKRIAQNMPALYDLLPSRAYVADAGGYVMDLRNNGSSLLDYDAIDRFLLADPGDHRNAALISRADNLHRRLDPLPPAAPEQYTIAGCNEPTISEYRLYDRGVIDVTRTAGDGTVPLVSALDRTDAARHYFISGKDTGITHGELVSDPRALALITAILDGRAASFALPDGFSTALSSCFPGAASGATAVEFSAHGVESATVIDGNGRSVGMNASGTIELGVPDSTYEAIGDNYFITVPAGEPYRFVSESTSSEDLAMAVKEYDGAAAGQVATYIVPPGTGTATSGASTSGTTTMTLDFGGNGSAQNAIVTVPAVTASDGDKSAAPSSTDITIAPFRFASSSDVIPPEISVSDLPDTAILGNTTTIVFSANDADAGLASVRATVNGTEVENGGTVVFSDVGTTVVRITAIDRAGNPSAREIDIPVVPPPPPEELSFLPSADAYLDAAHPTMNYGSGPMLRVRSRGKDRPVISFDVAAIRSAVGSRSIVSSSLIFAVDKNWGNWSSTGTLFLEDIATPWTESGVTWEVVSGMTPSSSFANGRPQTAVNNATAGSISFDVEGDVKAMVAGSPYFGWMMRKRDECTPGVIDLGSRESRDPPVLKIVIQ